MSVADEDIVSSPERSDVTIQLVNDEPPVITNTSSRQVFVEEGGPVSLVDPSVDIVDADNCEEHSLIREVRVTLSNPVVSEDQLIVNGSLLPNFETSFSCNQEEDGARCYSDYLLSLEYNNTEEEPGSFRIPRSFTIEVIQFGQICSFIHSSFVIL